MLHIARAGGTAVAAASALMVLASTGQTPHGFVNANFGSPLSVLGVSTTTEMQPDVLAIGDGTADPAELAELLQTAGSPTAAGSAFQAADNAANSASAAAAARAAAPGIALPPAADQPVASAPTSKQALRPVPVVDADGRVNCSGAVSCKTDPATNVTTVTYPDGTVAMVQKVNDLTLIAYQKMKDTVQSVVEALIPGAPAPLPAAAIEAAPAPEVAVKAAAPATPSATAPERAPDLPAPVRSIDPGPPAVKVNTPDISASTVRPRLTVITPPDDFSAGSADGSGSKPPRPVPPLLQENIDKVADAVGSAVNKIGEAVTKAINPGAATKAKPEAPDTAADAE